MSYALAAFTCTWVIVGACYMVFGPKRGMVKDQSALGVCFIIFALMLLAVVWGTGHDDPHTKTQVLCSAGEPDGFDSATMKCA